MGAAGIVICGRDAGAARRCATSSRRSAARRSSSRPTSPRRRSAARSSRACDERFGRLDGLVNAAGLSSRGTLDDTSAELWDRLFAVNARAPFLLMQEAARVMRRAGGGGSIVNIITMASHGGEPVLTGYAASKGALATLTRNAGYQLAPDRIRVNGLNIGWTATEGEHARADRRGPARRLARRRRTPAARSGRLLRPDDIAPMVTYLLSDAARMVTGSVIDFDQTVARPLRRARRAGDREVARMSFDLITMGRVGVDLYPEQIGVRAGRRAHVRQVARRQRDERRGRRRAAGRARAVITKVGDDPFGPYVRGALRGFGVDARWVGTHPTLRTPVVFCEIHPPDDFPLLFYREPTAPDMTLAVDELDLDAIRAARVFWTTGTGLSAEPSRAATLAALEARDGGGRRSRSTTSTTGRCSGPTSREAGALGARGAARTRRSRSATATRSRSRSARATRTRRRRRCSSSASRSRSSSRGRPACSRARRDGVVEVPPVPIEVVNGLGAGDAFGGALVHGLLQGWDARAHGAAGQRGRRLRGLQARVRRRDADPATSSREVPA